MLDQSNKIADEEDDDYGTAKTVATVKFDCF